MPSALGFIGGGLLEGFGKGLATQGLETGKDKRERARADLEHRRNLERDENKLAGQKDLLKTKSEIEGGRLGKPIAGLGPGGNPAFFRVPEAGGPAQPVEGDFTPAPKGPLVKIENPSQTIDSRLLDLDIQTVKDTQEAVKASQEFVPKLEVIIQGLESGNVESGRFQAAVLPLRQLAKSLGWTEDPNLAQTELVQSAMAFMIPRMRVPGSGQTSDTEINLFANATAKMENSTEGNILIARGTLQIHKWNKRFLAAQRAFLRKNKTLEGFDVDKELGSIFPKAATQEDVSKLKPGTVYIDTADGGFKVRPQTMPEPTRTDTGDAGTGQVEETKVLNGKTFVKIGGQWFEQ